MPSARPSLRLGALVVALAASLVACSSDDPAPVPIPSASTPLAAPPAALARYYDQTLTWAACDDGFQCSTVTVPRDWTTPAAGDIQVAVIRLPGGQAEAADRLPAHRPGRPRGLGRRLRPAGPGPVHGTGPGGVRHRRFRPPRRRPDHADPVPVLDQAVRLLPADPTPDDPARSRSSSSANTSFTQGCEQRSGAMLAARLHRGHRARHGRHPRRAGRRAALLPRCLLRHLPGRRLRRALPRQGRSAGPRRRDGPLARRRGHGQGSAKGLPAGVRLLRGRLREARRLPAARGPGGRGAAHRRPLQAAGRATAADLRLGPTVDGGARESRPRRGALRARVLLGAAAQRRSRRRSQATARSCSQLSDLYTHRHQDGSYDNLLEANFAINCLDRGSLKTLAEAEALVPEYEKLSPVFGAGFAWGTIACSDWPYAPWPRRPPIHADGAAPILVIGTTRDPATPYAWPRPSPASSLRASCSPTTATGTRPTTGAAAASTMPSRPTSSRARSPPTGPPARSGRPPGRVGYRSSPLANHGRRPP